MKQKYEILVNKLNKLIKTNLIYPFILISLLLMVLLSYLFLGATLDRDINASINLANYNLK